MIDWSPFFFSLWRFFCRWLRFCFIWRENIIRERKKKQTQEEEFDCPFYLDICSFLMVVRFLFRKEELLLPSYFFRKDLFLVSITNSKFLSLDTLLTSFRVRFVSEILVTKWYGRTNHYNNQHQMITKICIKLTITGTIDVNNPDQDRSLGIKPVFTSTMHIIRLAPSTCWKRWIIKNSFENALLRLRNANNGFGTHFLTSIKKFLVQIVRIPYENYILKLRNNFLKISVRRFSKRREPLCNFTEISLQ